jgi:hypothetical protein
VQAECQSANAIMVQMFTGYVVHEWPFWRILNTFPPNRLMVRWWSISDLGHIAVRANIVHLNDAYIMSVMAT